MSNQLNRTQDLSPATEDPAVTNALTALFGTRGAGDWVSAAYSAPGTPGGAAGGAVGASGVAFLLDFAFGTNATIELLPEHAPPKDPALGQLVDADFYPLGRLNATSQVENDVPILVPGNLIAGQAKIDLPLSVPTSHWVRLRARALGGAGGTLQAKVTAGRS